MRTIASQITSLTIVYWAVYSRRRWKKHQSSASLAFVRGIHRWPVNSLHKRPVTRKMFPFDDVIMHTNFDREPWCHMALLRHNELILQGMAWHKIWCTLQSLIETHVKQHETKKTHWNYSHSNSIGRFLKTPSPPPITNKMELHLDNITSDEGVLVSFPRTLLRCSSMQMGNNICCHDNNLCCLLCP